MVLNYIDIGTGPTIVLLHGMAGSHRYWNNFLPYIGSNRRIIAIDLLGFGKSPKPNNNNYDYMSHIESIKNTLDHAGVKDSFMLAGHSMGALIALKYSYTYPMFIKRLALIGMPIYENPSAAQASLTGNSYIKKLAYYGVTSRILCTLWCRLLKPLSSKVAPKYLPHLSEESAQDSVLHTWQSYSRSLSNIIEKQNVVESLMALNCPVLMLYGSADIPQSLDKIKNKINRPNITIIVKPGSHQIVHEKPDILAEWLAS